MPSRNLTDSEISSILPLLSIRDRALFTLGIRSGFRVSELLSIKVSDCIQHDAIRDTLTVTRSRMKGKRASRTIPLHSEAKRAIAHLILEYNLTPESYLFQSRKGINQPIEPRQVNRILKAAVNRLGLAGSISSHSMRKTLANRVYLASGKDIIATRDALGHSNSSSTSHYLAVSQEVVDALILGIK